MDFKQTFYLTISYFRKFKFFFREKISGAFDTFLYQLGINDNCINFDKKYAGKRIVFIGMTPNHRVVKNLKWLKRTSSFELIILWHTSTVLNDLLPGYYHKKILFRNKIHLKRIFRGMKNVDLVYGYASKPSYARVGIEMSHVPTVFDPYDTFIVYYGKNAPMQWLSKELVDEEFCYRNSTGLLARNSESYLAYKMYHINKTPNIFFSDYCDNDYFVDAKLNKIETEISMVYAGSIYGQHMKKSAHGFNDFSFLIENAELQKMHFYIYPSPLTDKEVFYDYVETANKLNYLHIEATADQKELSKELSKYHFGVLPHFKDPDSEILDAKLERGTSLKFYNFLEAGIPILVSREMKFMAWVVERYKIGIAFAKSDIPNLKNIIQKSDYGEMKKNVLAVREKLSMAKNTGRLVSFINKISEMKK